MNKKIGILDVKRENLNPLNNKTYSDEAKNLAKKWSVLPMYERRDEFLTTLDKNRVMLITSETGSGKSVIAPQLVSHYYNYTEKIAMSMPKQMITQSMAEYISKIMDVDLGQEIGYKYKGSPDKSASNNTKILYATDGTIVNKLLNNAKIPEYKCIIIDEAHERKVQIDFMLWLLRKTLSLRDDFKLIIMSATINVDIFKRYFSDYSFGLLDVGGKRNFEVKSIFTKSPVTNYIDSSYKIVKDIVNKGDKGDILVFVTSVKETEEICKLVNEDNSLSELFCVELYSGLSDDEQELAKNKTLFQTKDSKKKRKIVIATEVAESSITIDGIVYVIDNGKALQGGYDPVKRARTLQKTFITQSQIKQRKGRSGRTEPGVCYHLYTEEEYKKLIEFPEPIIRTSNITDECLKLLNIDQIGNVTNVVKTLVEFIEPPRENYITSAILQLNELGLIEQGEISKLGKCVSDIRTDSTMAVALINAAKFGVLKEVTRVVALINSSKGIFSNIFITIENKKDNKKSNNSESSQIHTSESSYDQTGGESVVAKLEKQKKGFADEYGDYISMLKIYSKAEEANMKNKLGDWCYKNFIKIKTIDKAFKEYQKLYNNIKQVIRKNNIQTDVDKIKDVSIKDRIQLSFQLVYPMNKGRLEKYGYNIEFSRSPVQLSKESLLNSGSSNKHPKRIFFGEYGVILGGEKLSMVGKYIST